MGQSFHAHPSVAQIIDPPPNFYSRATPLQADVLEFSTIHPSIGYYDKINFCYVALTPQVVRFDAHLLFQTPNDGSVMNAWFMKNDLPRPDGSIGGEMCGDDVIVYQKSGSPLVNQSCRVFRRMFLISGDRVWCVPGMAGGGQLTNAVAANGNNTVNYFEGEVIEVLPTIYS